jgi:hypothetical protein
MRCILVTGAKLKTDSCCSCCCKQIGDGYVREIGTGRVFCDYECYCIAVRAPVVTLQFRARQLTSWRASS